MQTKVNKTLLNLNENNPPDSFAVLAGVNNKGVTVFVYANDEKQLKEFDIRTENLVNINYIKTVKEADKDKIKFITTDIQALFECGVHDFVDASGLDTENELYNILKTYYIIENLVRQAINEIWDQVDYVSSVEKFIEDFEVNLE